MEVMIKEMAKKLEEKDKIIAQSTKVSNQSHK